VREILRVGVGMKRGEWSENLGIRKIERKMYLIFLNRALDFAWFEFFYHLIFL